MKTNFAILMMAACLAIASVHAMGAAFAPARPPQDPATQTPASQPAASQDMKSVWDGVYTEDQAKRGAAVYRQWCSSCHGNELEGGEMAPGLTGGGFTSNWNGLTVGDIFDRTRTTMPQDSPGALSREQVADVTAYILSMNKFPAGQTELPTQSEVLKQIKFEATKPGH
jgi:mono/diheme cytochrome c family protein